MAKYKKPRWVMDFQGSYNEGYIAGLKEMYSVLSKMIPSDVLKNFNVNEYIQTKTQQR